MAGGAGGGGGAGQRRPRLTLTLALSLALALALALTQTRYVSVSSGGELNEVGRMMESMAAADASPLPVDLEVALRPPGDQREL